MEGECGMEGACECLDAAERTTTKAAEANEQIGQCNKGVAAPSSVANTKLSLSELYIEFDRQEWRWNREPRRIQMVYDFVSPS